MSDLWSNDKCFDPLLRHIQARGLKCRRDGQARPAPAPQRPLPVRALVVADLLKRSGKNKRPRKRATLANCLATRFHKRLKAEEIKQAIEQLPEAGLTAGTEATVTYNWLGLTAAGVHVMFKVLSLMLAFILGLSACAVFETSEATHMLNGQAFPPVPVESVEIYIQKPEFAYVIVGSVEARGMGITNETRDQELAIAALKREAASIGADGVIVTDSDQKIASVSQYGTSTERRIKGTAIRRERE